MRVLRKFWKLKKKKNLTKFGHQQAYSDTPALHYHSARCGWGHVAEMGGCGQGFCLGRGWEGVWLGRKCGLGIARNGVWLSLGMWLDLCSWGCIAYVKAVARVLWFVGISGECGQGAARLCGWRFMLLGLCLARECSRRQDVAGGRMCLGCRQRYTIRRVQLICSLEDARLDIWGICLKVKNVPQG